jgi:hypothetical protein
MPKLIIDFRFVDVLYELNATARYISLFEDQLPDLIKQEEEKALCQIREERLTLDNGEADLIRQELYDLTENVLPRFFRNAILVTIWSIFESAIIDISKELQSKQHKTLGIDDLKGDVLDRAKKYFHNIINFPLNVTGKEWLRINMLKVLRNAIAHCNGRIENITKDKDLKDIQRWEKENIGLTIETGNLMFSRDFVEETYYYINNFLTSLIADVKRSYPVQKD